ncbi:pimeloyl-CoA dehydrogenase large subunit, partial [Thermodesulfobacteriota bacterium]
SGAHRADCMFLLARTNPKEKRSKGLSVFHVSMDQPGIEVRPIPYMDGSHRLYNEVFLNDVKVPEQDRIGQEGKGWSLTREAMNFESDALKRYSIMPKRPKGMAAPYLKIFL